MEKQKKIESIGKHRNLLNAVRRLKTNDRSILSSSASLSWPTVESNAKKLGLDKNKKKPGKDDAIYLDSSGTYRISPKYGFFVGISVSVGSSKITVCDFSLTPLTGKDFDAYGITNFYKVLTELDPACVESSGGCSVCHKTTDGFTEIRNMLSCVIDLLLREDENNSAFDLLGIGIAFPGIINFQSNRIEFSPNIESIRDKHLSALIPSTHLQDIKDRHIVLYFEHDTECATLYEKEKLYDPKCRDYRLRNKENLACVYIGTGVGLGLIMNHTLVRGSNSCGELGHIKTPQIVIPDPPEGTPEYFDMKGYTLTERKMEKPVDIHATKCACGKTDCLEKRIRADVFNSDSQDDYNSKTTTERLNEFQEKHPYRYRVLEEYVAYILSLLIDLLGVDVIVFSGKLISKIPSLKGDLETLKYANSIAISAINCTLIEGSQDIESVAIGAAMAAFNKCDYTGNPIQVSWLKTGEDS